MFVHRTDHIQHRQWTLCVPQFAGGPLGSRSPRLKPTYSGVRRKFSWGGFIQWHRVVICIWCALIVTSQFDVIVLFPIQRFGEVC